MHSCAPVQLNIKIVQGKAATDQWWDRKFRYNFSAVRLRVWQWQKY